MARARPLSWFIGLRYVRSRQDEGYFSLVSIFSFATMTLGVAALIVVLSVMNGFDREIKQRILNVIPHLSLTYTSRGNNTEADLAELATMPGVTRASAFVDGQGMLSAMGNLQGVSVQGVDPATDDSLDLLRDSLISGSLDALQPGEFGVVIGSILARSLNVIRGDDVLLTLPEMTLTPVGAFPRVKRLKVVAIYQVGAQVDNGIAMIHIADAQKLFRFGSDVEGLRVSVDDPFALDDIQARLTDLFQKRAEVASWQSAMKTLFAAIKMEKIVVGVLLAVIIAVAGFNIVASLVLMVANKRKDIAVLRAMGAPSSAITAIFQVQGAATGLSGVALGAAAGCLLSWRLGEIVQFVERMAGVTLFDPEIYFISQLPSQLRLQDVLVITALGAVISLLATLYPAYRAGQVSPAEVLRYEH